MPLKYWLWNFDDMIVRTVAVDVNINDSPHDNNVINVLFSWSSFCNSFSGILISSSECNELLCKSSPQLTSKQLKLSIASCMGEEIMASDSKFGIYILMYFGSSSQSRIHSE